jgi:signal peptidase I
VAQGQLGAGQPNLPHLPGTPERKANRSSRSGVALLIGAALALVMLPISCRSLVVEAFKIPSAGMFPTLEVGDHLFVTKSTYGLFSKSAPEHGDVVVFRYPDPDPNSPRADFIERVIALPGDTLQVEAGVPTINGWKLPRCHLGFAKLRIGFDDVVSEMDVFVEFLRGHAYLVVDDRLLEDPGIQGPYKVGPGEFWVIGDNRDNSSDSRSWRDGRGAGVPFDHLLGRASYIWLPPERVGITSNGAPVLPSSLKQLQPQLDSCLAKAPSLADSTPPPPR